MASLIDAIKTKHAAIEAQITGGIWYGRAPSSVEKPTGTFAPYTEFGFPLGSDSSPPGGMSVERAFGSKRLNNSIVWFHLYALKSNFETLVKLLRDTFDESTLVITDTTFLKFVEITPEPLIEDLQIRRDGNHLYRGTVWFEAVTDG